MKNRRLLILAAAVLAALMAVTAFADGTEVTTAEQLETALAGANSGDTVVLGNHISLQNKDLTLKEGVLLTANSSGSTQYDLTAGNGAVFRVQLPAYVGNKLNLKTAGTGRVVFMDGGTAVNGFVTAAKAGTKDAAAKDGVFYVDTKAAAADVTLKVSNLFKEANENVPEGYAALSLYLVDESGITRDGDGNITAVNPEKVFGGSYAAAAGEVKFTDVALSGKTYAVMARIGGAKGSLIETQNRLVPFDSSKIKVDAENLSWTNLKAGWAYKAFRITNPDKFPVTATVEGAGADAMEVTADGVLTALKPMAKAQVEVKFTFDLPDGSKLELSGGKRDIELKSPVTAPSSVTVYTNQRTQVFTISLPESGKDGYAGFTLTGVSDDSADIVFSMENDERYITATKNLNGVTVNFTFSFDDGRGHTFSVVHPVKITSKTYNPTHLVSVVAPKLYISVGESIQLSVPFENISNAYSSNPSVAFATGDGRVIGISQGSATIYVTTKESGQGTIQIMVTGASASVYAGKTVLAEDETTQIYFAGGTPVTFAYSSNTRVVKVTKTGFVTAVSPGTATVYVTGANGTGGTVTFVVTKKALKVSGTAKIAVGQMAWLTVPADETIASVTSSNPAVVGVTGGGYYTGLRPGTATLTVTALSGRTGTFTVTVIGPDSPANTKTIKVGETAQLTASGGSVVAAWSENEKVATVTNSGKVTGKSAGTTKVHLFTRTGSHVTWTVTVTGSSQTSTKKLLVDQSITLKISGKRIVAATLEEDNGTLSVTSSGKVTALAAGTDTVLLITSDNRVYRVKVTVEARSGKISASKVKLRSRAGSGTVLATLSKNTKVTIVARSGSYYKVQVTIKGKTYTGYVPRSNVKK